MNNKMRAVMFEGIPEKVAFREVPIPEISEGEALVKVKYVGLCGSDIDLVAGNRKIVNPPIIPGHEIVGKIIDIKGKNKSYINKRVVVEPTISCGYCQMCLIELPHICYKLKVLGVHLNGGMAEYIKVPIKKLHFIPNSLPDEKAIITEPLAVAVHVVNRSHLKLGQDVLIIGGGPIGLLIAQVCRVSGANKIFLMELNKYRQSVCQQLGFEVVNIDQLEKYKKVPDWKDFDIGYEVSGSKDGLNQIIKNVRNQGRIIIVGLFKEQYPISLSEVLFRELEIIGSRVYESKDFKLAINLIYKDKVIVEPLVTDVLNMEDFLSGIQRASSKKSMKVIIKI